MKDACYRTVCMIYHYQFSNSKYVNNYMFFPYVLCIFSAFKEQICDWGKNKYIGHKAAQLFRIELVIQLVDLRENYVIPLLVWKK